jgi:ribose 5-phosphate isomerase B
MSKKISIGSDHAGFELKEKVKEHLKSKGFQVLDKGCFSPDRADYPDYGHAVALSVTHKESELGILLCGSGVGISISANKHKGIRAALCWNPEIAKLSRQHNDANVLVLPARFISAEAAFECADIFISEQFEGGRHQARVDKIEI